VLPRFAPSKAEPAGAWLYDTAGKKRGAFFHDEHGACLVLQDANAKPRVAMGVTADGPHLSIAARSGATVFAKPRRRRRQKCVFWKTIL
jgi:hypothetical protein